MRFSLRVVLQALFRPPVIIGLSTKMSGTQRLLITFKFGHVVIYVLYDKLDIREPSNILLNNIMNTSINFPLLSTKYKYIIVDYLPT